MTLGREDLLLTRGGDGVDVGVGVGVGGAGMHSIKSCERTSDTSIQNRLVRLVRHAAWRQGVEAGRGAGRGGRAWRQDLEKGVEQGLENGLG